MKKCFLKLWYHRDRREAGQQKCNCQIYHADVYSRKKVALEKGDTISPPIGSESSRELELTFFSLVSFLCPPSYAAKRVNPRSFSLLFVNFEDVLCVLGAQSNNSNNFFCM